MSCPIHLVVFPSRFFATVGLLPKQLRVETHKFTFPTEVPPIHSIIHEDQTKVRDSTLMDWIAGAICEQGCTTTRLGQPYNVKKTHESWELIRPQSDIFILMSISKFDRSYFSWLCQLGRYLNLWFWNFVKYAHNIGLTTIEHPLWGELYKRVEHCASDKSCI